MQGWLRPLGARCTVYLMQLGALRGRKLVRSQLCSSVKLFVSGNHRKGVLCRH
jgi:hypothetical protein